MIEIAPSTKAIIWDLDGTLIDSFGVFNDSVMMLAPKFGIDVPSPEKILANYHGSLEESIAGAFDHKLSQTDAKEFLQQFLTHQDLLYAHMEGHLLEDAVTLSRCAAERGLRQAIVTNRDHEGRNNASPRNIVAGTELSDCIEEILCGDEVEYRKPDARVLGDLLLRWRVEPIEVLVIGDQFVDAQLALNLGSSAVIVTRGEQQLAHAHKLPEGWQQQVTVVPTLDNVSF